MATKGYQSYRGRGGLLRGLAAAVLILILLGACAFMLALRYVTYTDDGGMRLDLPFLEQGIELNLPVLFRPASQPDPQEPAVGDGEADLNLVVESAGGEDPAAEPESVPEPEAAERRLISLDQLPETSEALAEQVRAAGASGFVWTARGRNGGVNYASGEATEKALPAGGVAMESVKALLEGAGDVYAVARMGCFHDNYYAFANMKEAAICQRNGYVWYSGTSDHWLEPDKAEARRYVIALAVECAKMGFDEVLLDDVSYPVSGKLQKIDYSGNTQGKTEALTQFLTELRQALEPYGARVSLVLDEALLLAGSGADSGQSLTAFAPLIDAVYAVSADPAAVRLQLEAAAGESPVPALVPVVAAPQAEGDWCLAG